VLRAGVGFEEEGRLTGLDAKREAPAAKRALPDLRQEAIRDVPIDAAIHSFELGALVADQ
jgi:hypothetical protein